MPESETTSQSYAESLTKRRDRHETHQAKMEAQKQAKALARERHRAGWHRFKILATTLILA